MTPPIVDVGYDEWRAEFVKACEAQGALDLAQPGACDAQLLQLFEEGRTPDEALEILHFS